MQVVSDQCFRPTFVTFLLSFFVGFMSSMFTFSLLKHSTKLLKLLVSAPADASNFGKMLTSGNFHHALIWHELIGIVAPRIPVGKAGSVQ